MSRKPSPPPKGRGSPHRGLRRQHHLGGRHRGRRGGRPLRPPEQVKLVKDSQGFRRACDHAPGATPFFNGTCGRTRQQPLIGRRPAA
jgi:hypothetical protein